MYWNARPLRATLVGIAAASLLLLATPQLNARSRTGQVPVNISANPNPVTSGQNVVITVTMSGTVTSDQSVATSYSNNQFTSGDNGEAAFGNFPASITIPAGYSSASFTVSTSGSGIPTVTADANGGNASANVTIQ